MPISKFCSNSPSVLSRLKTISSEIGKIYLGEGNAKKTLGTQWVRYDEEQTYKIKLYSNPRPTRRAFVRNCQNI